MKDILYKKITTNDLTKFVDKQNLFDLFDNIANVRKFCKNDKAFSDEVLSRYLQYFQAISSDVYIHYVDESKSRIDGMAMVVFEAQTDIKPNDIPDKHLNESNKDFEIENDFIKFRQRVNEAYLKMYSRNNIVKNAELEIFSVLNNGNGIGKKLIQMFETDLKHQGINKYYLCTNGLCTHEWYQKHGYRIVDRYRVDIDDLQHIKKMLLSQMPNCLTCIEFEALIYVKELEN